MSEFDPWGTRADPARIRASAENLRSLTGVLLGHIGDVDTVLNEVALNFSEVIAPVVAAQIGANVAVLEAAVEATEYGYAVGAAWAEDVESFLAARESLIAAWQEAELAGFGAWPPLGLANADPEMAEGIYANRTSIIGMARACALRRYEAEGLRLWEEFQLQVQLRGRMFREGPTEVNLLQLLPYLGWGAMTLWPETATTPVSGAAEGAADGATVVEGLDGASPAQAVSEVLSIIAVLGQRAASGHELTDHELDYLENFYATVGSRVLDIPTYLRSSTGPVMYDAADAPTYSPSVPFDGDPQVVQMLTMATANGLLLLSKPTSRPEDDCHDGYERLPTWLRNTLACDNFDPYNSPYTHFQRLTELGSLLNSSTVEAGPGLSRELAESVGWMIDYVDSREESLSDQAEQDMREQIAVHAPPLLDVVRRNDEVCFGLLTGGGMSQTYSPTDYFTGLYCFDWAADGGAAAAGLTDFIPAWATSADSIDQARSQTAMLDLVQIVTHDSSFGLLLDGVGDSGVAAESAIGQVNPAITQGLVTALAPFMDEFATPQSHSASPRGLSDLTFDTRVRFATLIGTDPQSATALAAVAYTYEQQQLYDYAVSRDGEVIGGQVGRIRGIVETGIVNAALDAGADRIEAADSAARARQMGSEVAQGILGGVPIPGFSAVVDTAFAVLHGNAPDGGNGQPLEELSPSRSEAERRYDAVSGVMTGLVSTGHIPACALPVPFIGPVAQPVAPERLTDDLLKIATTYGYDLTGVLDRIESAYSDQELADERGP